MRNNLITRTLSVVSISALLCGFSLASPQATMHGTDKTIVQTAVDAGQFKTLVAALQAAGLVETLQGAGPFTVFAPDDNAFAKLPAGTVQNLLKPENKQKLVDILTYHVVAGRVMSKDIVGKKLEEKTVEGSMLDVDGTKGVMVENAKVIGADVVASNGVIHVIDTVLMPK